MSRPPRKEADESSPESFLHKKSLGQHFLTSDVVPKWLCDAGTVAVGDHVIEIGPGTGALTAELLTKGARVTAFEADARTIPILEERFGEAISSGQLTLIHSDVRDGISLATIPLGENYKIIANIPYYLSGFLLRLCLGVPRPPQTLVFLMQKEMVERITRDPKSSLLALSVAVYGTPKYVKTVSRGHFSPPPRVDSAILAITDINHHHLPDTDTTARFFAHLHLGFGQKRKQLLGNLAAVYSREDLTALFTTLELPLTIRGEDVALKDWLTLSAALSTLPSSKPLVTPQ